MSNTLREITKAQNKARTETPQRVRTPGRTDEVKNDAGGFVFTVSDKSRLERFLILGTDGASYRSAFKITQSNIEFVKRLIAEDERLVREVLSSVADENRAPSNSPSLFVLALLFVEGQNKDAAKALVNKVARTSTHLFEFAQYIDDLGGWGRSKRAAVANWYESKAPEALAYQAVKYRQRNGWTHRDLFRLSHPKGVNPAVGNFILGKNEVRDNTPVSDLSILNGFEFMQKAGSVKEVLSVLEQFKNLPWETIPTEFLKDAKVWKALFYNGALGQTALLRNLTRFAKIGAFNDLVFAGDVAARLADVEQIVKGRVHPVQYANALGIYRDGQPVGANGYYSRIHRVKDWETNAKVLGAVEAGFYNSFAAVEPANKATMLSVDVSASMTWGTPSGLVGMDYRTAAAAMAMVTVRTEPYVIINAFAGEMVPINISDRDSLETVVRKFGSLPASRTDCSQPMLHATKSGLGIDTFVIYTDNDTWAGYVKPYQALRNYRKGSGRDARLAVVGMTATEFTIADPTDRGMLDLVGFDASAPKILSDFSAGRI